MSDSCCLTAAVMTIEFKMFIRHKYKYRIKNKRKPTVPDRRTNKTKEYKYKYTKSSKLHVIQTDGQSKREQVASFYLRSQCHQIWSSSLTVWRCRLHKQENLSYLQHSETSIAVTHKSNQTIIHHKNYCTSLTDSQRLYLNNLRKQSFHLSN